MYHDEIDIGEKVLVAGLYDSDSKFFNHKIGYIKRIYFSTEILEQYSAYIATVVIDEIYEIEINFSYLYRLDELEEVNINALPPSMEKHLRYHNIEYSKVIFNTEGNAFLFAYTNGNELIPLTLTTLN